MKVIYLHQLMCVANLLYWRALGQGYQSCHAMPSPHSPSALFLQSPSHYETLWVRTVRAVVLHKILIVFCHNSQENLCNLTCIVHQFGTFCVTEFPTAAKTISRQLYYCMVHNSLLFIDIDVITLHKCCTALLFLTLETVQYSQAHSYF